MIQTLKIPITTTANQTYIKEGDTIPKITFTFGASDVIDLTTSTIKMQVYNGSTRLIDVSSGSGITILSEKVFKIDEISATNNNMPSGKFLGDLEIQDSNGKRFTYFNIEYTIIKQYTNLFNVLQ